MKWALKHIKSLLILISAPVFYGLSLLVASHPILYESMGTGRGFRMILSQITGVVPFSLAELITIVHILFIPVFIVMLIIRVFKGGALKMLYHGLVYMAALYTAFMALWGLNYSRMSIGDMLGLEVHPYTASALYATTESLAQDANALRAEISEDKNGVMIVTGGWESIFENAHQGYDVISGSIPALGGQYGRAKPILFSNWMLYTNITGVFFPYTAEANVNTAVPDLLLPATTLHEMAHQRGFAPEDEANFIAYLTARAHPDPVYQYSGTMLALIHAYNALAAQDQALAERIYSIFSEGVKRDLAAQNEFWKPYKGRVSETAERVNDTYLKSNRQSEGTKSYGRMVDWLIADYLQKTADML